MKKDNKFIEHFFKDCVSFFAAPLPDKEEVFNVNYTAATTEWRLICKEIDQYKLGDDTIKGLERLFLLAQRFLYKLKGSEVEYARAKNSLQPQWKEIQAVANSFKRYLR